MSLGSYNNITPRIGEEPNYVVGWMVTIIMEALPHISRLTIEKALQEHQGRMHDAVDSLVSGFQRPSGPSTVHNPLTRTLVYNSGRQVSTQRENTPAQHPPNTDAISVNDRPNPKTEETLSIRPKTNRSPSPSVPSSLDERTYRLIKIAHHYQNMTTHLLEADRSSSGGEGASNDIATAAVEKTRRLVTHIYNSLEVDKGDVDPPLERTKRRRLENWAGKLVGEAPGLSSLSESRPAGRSAKAFVGQVSRGSLDADTHRQRVGNLKPSFILRHIATPVQEAIQSREKEARLETPGSLLGENKQTIDSHASLEGDGTEQHMPLNRAPLGPKYLGSVEKLPDIPKEKSSVGVHPNQNSATSQNLRLHKCLLQINDGEVMGSQAQQFGWGAKVSFTGIFNGVPTITLFLTLNKDGPSKLITGSSNTQNSAIGWAVGTSAEKRHLSIEDVEFLFAKVRRPCAATSPTQVVTRAPEGPSLRVVNCQLQSNRFHCHGAMDWKLWKGIDDKVKNSLMELFLIPPCRVRIFAVYDISEHPLSRELVELGSSTSWYQAGRATMRPLGEGEEVEGEQIRALRRAGDGRP